MRFSIWDLLASRLKNVGAGEKSHNLAENTSISTYEAGLQVLGGPWDKSPGNRRVEAEFARLRNINISIEHGLNSR
jgi:hypothetical protein